MIYNKMKDKSKLKLTIIFCPETLLSHFRAQLAIVPLTTQLYKAIYIACNK